MPNKYLLNTPLGHCSYLGGPSKAQLVNLALHFISKVEVPNPKSPALMQVHTPNLDFPRIPKPSSVCARPLSFPSVSFSLIVPCALISSFQSKSHGWALGQHRQPRPWKASHRQGEIINTINHNSKNLYSGTFLLPGWGLFNLWLDSLVTGLLGY